MTAVDIQKQQNIEIFLEEIDDPDEPDEPTLRGLINHILEQRAINEMQNNDKRVLKRRQQ